MTRIFAWLNAMKFGLIVGACIGFAFLYWVGVPWFLPPYESVRADLRDLQGVAEKVVGVVDEAEGLRAEENAVSVEAVSEERAAHQDEVNRLLNTITILSAQIQEVEYDESNCPVRRLIPAHQLHGDEIPRAADVAGEGDGPPDLREAPG
ncbi:hypothetical protein [Maricaulis sp. MIT060901]|uniref:hypothetical protein n=1 Tax=Maricaulis sp. MIT060901 TaxID=3096993 RepID=UPI003999C18D